MPQFSTLELVADIVIRRTVADVGHGNNLHAALERAYPFPDGNTFRIAWTEALRRHGIAAAQPAPSENALTDCADLYLS
jgi:hypothetical protein